MEAAEGIDLLVIANGQEPFMDPNFRYLSNNQAGLFEGGTLIARPDGSIDVLVSRMEELSARQGKGTVHSYETRKERDEKLSALLAGAQFLGVNSGSIALREADYLRSMLPGAELVDASAALSAARSIKDEAEIAAMREACRISSEVAQEIPDFLKEGMSEEEARARIDLLLLEKGGEGNAFDSIVAFGEGAAEPHHRPGKRRLRKGDAALFDFGCRYDGYCSDLTRTVFLGEPEPQMLRAYEVVLRAKEAGQAAIREGVKASEIDAIARKIIDDSEFEGLFLHSFGHGIGMSVHESGSLSPSSEMILQEGMVVTAEPGIYIEGVGGVRIEDTVLVRKDGCEPLTSFDKSLTVI